MPLTMSLLPHSTHRDFAVLSAEHDGTAKTQFRKSNHEQTLCPIQTGSVRTLCDTSLTQFEDILPICREGCLCRQRTLTHPFLLYQLRGQDFYSHIFFLCFLSSPIPSPSSIVSFSESRSLVILHGGHKGSCTLKKVCQGDGCQPLPECAKAKLNTLLGHVLSVRLSVNSSCQTY